MSERSTYYSKLIYLLTQSNTLTIKWIYLDKFETFYEIFNYKKNFSLKINPALTLPFLSLQTLTLPILSLQTLTLPLLFLQTFSKHWGFVPSGRAFGLARPASCINSKAKFTLWTCKKKTEGINGNVSFMQKK